MHIIKTRLYLTVITFLVFYLGCNKDLGTEPPQGPKWRVYTKASTGGGLLDNSINALSVDDDNRIWMGTDEGASVLRGSIWSTYTTQLVYQEYLNGGGQITRHKVSAIAHGIDGSTWFGLSGGGVRRYNPNSSTQQWTNYVSSSPSSISGDNIRQIAADQFGASGSSNIWVVPDLSGIDRFKPRPTDVANGDWEIYTTSNGLPANRVYSVQVNFVRRIVWFGTAYGELVKFDGSSWNFEGVSNYQSIVKTIAIEGSDIVWVGTDNGAFRRSISWTQFTKDTTGNSLPSNKVNAIVVEASGIKWFGTDEGLARFDNFNWQVFNTSNSPLPSNSINVLTIDIDGRIWIGTPNGAVVYDPKGKD